jgi:hypothetical protein
VADHTSDTKRRLLHPGAVVAGYALFVLHRYVEFPADSTVIPERSSLNLPSYFFGSTIVIPTGMLSPLDRFVAAASISGSECFERTGR